MKEVLEVLMLEKKLPLLIDICYDFKALISLMRINT